MPNNHTTNLVRQNVLFCNQCGANVLYTRPSGDTRKRYVCEKCKNIHYQNPHVIVGTVPLLDGRILLCRRAIGPRYNTWTLPAGFMELGETTVQGAARETLEESGAFVEVGALFTLISVPGLNQVHLFYLAKVTKLQACPCIESSEVVHYDEDNIPWKELSFHTVVTTIQHFIKDRRRGIMGFHHYSISPDC